jgi:hypothetical protein
MAFRIKDGGFFHVNEMPICSRMSNVQLLDNSDKDHPDSAVSERFLFERG